MEVESKATCKDEGSSMLRQTNEFVPTVKVECQSRNDETFHLLLS
jgi:hypothetical protein